MFKPKYISLFLFAILLFTNADAFSFKKEIKQVWSNLKEDTRGVRKSIQKEYNKLRDKTRPFRRKLENKSKEYLQAAKDLLDYDSSSWEQAHMEDSNNFQFGYLFKDEEAQLYDNSSLLSLVPSSEELTARYFLAYEGEVAVCQGEENICFMPEKRENFSDLASITTESDSLAVLVINAEMMCVILENASFHLRHVAENLLSFSIDKGQSFGFVFKQPEDFLILELFESTTARTPIRLAFDKEAPELDYIKKILAPTNFDLKYFNYDPKSAMLTFHISRKK